MMMMSKKKFVPVMITPFLENGAVDYDGLTQITEMYLTAGVGGLFANCLSSEMFELNEDERLKVVDHVVRLVNGSVPVVATGTFGGKVDMQADFVRKIYNKGVQAVIISTSIMAFQTESDAVFSEKVYQLMEATGDIPFGFYECPVPYKRLISPQLLNEFVRSGRLVYHKDTCCDILQVKEKLEATSEFSQFGFYDAYLAHAVDSLRAGSAGLSCIQGNFWPELIVWLCEHAENIEMETEVNKVQNFFREKMTIVHAVYPIIAKYFLQKRGIKIGTFTRQEVGLFTREIKENIDNLFCESQILYEELKLSQEA